MIFPISRLDRFYKTSPLSKGIVSIWGEFGVGKTTLALQTALKSIINSSQILYFYTKPILPLEKIVKVIGRSDETLKKIHFIQLKDFDELYKIVFNLEFLILENLGKTKKPYKIIVIDSLTDLYRLKVNREKKEKNYNLNYRLNQILANLFYINISYEL
ncbi:MAG: AAA family ATPase [Promethearchaeota archaeon]|jgi:RecA/RadA recombinase